MKNYSKMAVVATVAMLAAGSYAELVGSLLTATGGNIYNDQQSIGPLVTRTSDGNLNTRGVVEGAINLIAGDVLGAGGYVGMDLSSWSGNTQYKNTVRYGSHNGLTAYDFDFSTYLTTHAAGATIGDYTYSLDLDYYARRGDGIDATYYLSYNKIGGGLTLDATDVKTLVPNGGTAQAALVADTSKYTSIAILTGGVVSNTVSFDVTSLIADSSDGQFRLVLANPEFNGNISYQNSTGISAVEVIPEPATLGLVGLCGGAILFFRRRFKI